MVDFAGGIVVHISAGFAALASVFVVGPRQYSSEVDREMSRVITISHFDVKFVEA